MPSKHPRIAVTADPELGEALARAGRNRCLAAEVLPLNVGRKADLGRYTVKVELEIGGRIATRTVTILVTR